MRFGRELKSHCPAAMQSRRKPGRFGFLGRIGRWVPLVCPWSAMQRMTGLVFSDAGVTMARGRLDGRLFHVDKATCLSGSDPALDFGIPGIPGREPVCICLPRDRTLVRHFRVPAESPGEIEAMLPHLLAGELPLAVENFTWVWMPLPTREDGFTKVAVYVARNDRLEEFLTPLADADLNIVGLIPEGWSWAYAMEQVGGGDSPSDESGARSIIVRTDGAHYLVVGRSGQLLFDKILAPTASMDWDGPDLAEAREEFAEHLGFPLPPPAIWPDAIAPHGEDEPEELFFAACVAAVGLGRDCLMMSRNMRQLTRRRTALGVLADLGRLGILVVLVWLASAIYLDGQTRRHLNGLERQLAEEASRVEVLETEYNAIRESSRERAGSTEILQVLDSLRRHVKDPVHLVHVNYVRDRGVTLRGVAPFSAQVLEMTEQLAADRLWQGLRVMQLRSERTNGTDQVHFTVEGRLD